MQETMVGAKVAGVVTERAFGAGGGHFESLD
jgi:hypothetical protein